MSDNTAFRAELEERTKKINEQIEVICQKKKDIRALFLRL